MRRAAATAATAAVALTALLGAVAPAGAADDAPVARVLVFALPHVDWDDIRSNDLPNLERLLGASGVAALTARTEDRTTRLADGYLTFGAGTRAIGDTATDGDNLGVEEEFGRDRAGDVFTQRTGRVVRRGIVSLGQPRLVRNNDARLYDAELGALADALDAAGIDRAVVANGDGDQPDTHLPEAPEIRRRQAALGLMDSEGRVPAGRVDDGLLEAAPAAPYGVRLDPDAVVRAFDEAWRDESVVLVEASDLVREDAYRPYAQADNRPAMFRRALRHSDELLGRLLQSVDLTRDAVVVFGPAHAAATTSLTVLGVHAPGVEPGLLRSATTRRSGFVQMIDVGPTILDLLDIDAPSSMEGRPVEIGGDGGSFDDRMDLFAYEDAAGQFRDRLIGQTQLLFVVLSAALVLATVLVLGRAGSSGARLLVGRAALTVLALLPAVFLARLAPLHELGIVPYWAYLVVVAIALGTVFHRLGRDRPLDALLVALLTNVVLLVGDVIVGTPLAFNSALGYSPTVAGRFAGFANPAYAIVGASAVLAAPLLAQRVGGRRGVGVAVAMLAAVVVVDGAPFWGSDVGGILSLVPACGIAAALLLGWSVSARTILWCFTGLLVAVTTFTLLDLSRSPDERTHLGRLVERVDERGFGDFVTVVQRKLTVNLGTLTTSIWGIMLPIALLLLLWLVRRAPGRADAIRDAVPGWRVALIAFGVLAVLGYAFNDSGIAIPGAMLVVLVGAIVWLLASVEPTTDPKPAPRPARVAATSVR
jgi:hypothetical protein